MKFENLIVETHGPVGLIRLNRPEALNALSMELRAELRDAVAAFEADPDIAAMVLTGGEKAFAAGADLKVMQNWDFNAVREATHATAAWEQIRRCKKPIVAAVSGYALGGGCELAMMCDFILAAPDAQFGQPEIKVGTIPGAGGTQRLVRAIGKSKAMEMVLTGRMMDADEAERCGLISRIVESDKLVDEAIAAAGRIARLSAPIVGMAKDAVNRAFETPLEEGLRYERALFQSTFATEDRREGMTAFIEKRKPVFHGR